MEELLIQAHNLEKSNIKDFNNCSVTSCVSELQIIARWYFTGVTGDYVFKCIHVHAEEILGVL